MTRLVGQGKFRPRRRSRSRHGEGLRLRRRRHGGRLRLRHRERHEANVAGGADRLEQADLMGNRSPLAAPGGRVTLDLTERPIYLVGASLDALTPYCVLHSQ